MVGQAGCIDAICSAGSSTNTTDELHERICAPYGRWAQATVAPAV